MKAENLNILFNATFRWLNGCFGWIAGVFILFFVGAHNGNAFFTIKNAVHHRSNILRESSQIEVEKVILLGSILKFNLLPPLTVLIF